MKDEIIPKPGHAKKGLHILYTFCNTTTYLSGFQQNGVASPPNFLLV